jgi:LAS superfamily LD-carboxypeptidase LdcB
MLDPLELTGRARSHVVQRDDLGAAVHRQALDSYLALKAAAARDGLELRIVSGFRDFDAQLRIWNMKYRGERPLYDAAGNVRAHGDLDPSQLIEGILCWSALPGASRHHWGTDIDVIDAAAIPEDYRVRLLPEEFASAGVFHRLGVWLDENIARFGFFRPYGEYRGGVYPEPWHLSHAAIAAAALELLTPDLIAETVRESDVLGREQLLADLPEIYRKYVINISPPDAAARTDPAMPAAGPD